MIDAADSAAPRPRDLAVLLLASSEWLPRQRARDQQADRAGMDLKRRLLEQIVAADPEAVDLEASLIEIVNQIGPPTGPTRALAVSFLQDYATACRTPAWMEQLIAEATRSRETKTEDQCRGGSSA